MKYYSELTKKMYDTEDALKKAESELTESKEKTAISKKESAKKVELADKKYRDALDSYDEAEIRVQDLIEQTKSKIEDMLKVPIQNIKKAKEERLEALLDFNKKYGPYTTSYSGEQASKEYERLLKANGWFDTLLDSWDFPFIW